MTFINREQNSLSHDRRDVSVLVGNVRKMSGVAVQLSLFGGENK
jgi:hypothetical protein